MSKNREQWLTEAVVALAEEVFTPAGLEVPEVHVSVGWPGGKGRKNSVIGQCWHKDASADGVAQVFISPVLADGVDVLAVLAHEVVHAIDENASGHRGAFAKMARAIGLEGKMTATHAGEALLETLTTMDARLGAYPHAGMSADESGRKKQTTRMLKVVCPESGYTLRTTKKWLLDYGVPLCPCHKEEMAADF